MLNKNGQTVNLEETNTIKSLLGNDYILKTQKKKKSINVNPILNGFNSVVEQNPDSLF